MYTYHGDTLAEWLRDAAKAFRARDDELVVAEAEVARAHSARRRLLDDAPNVAARSAQLHQAIAGGDPRASAINDELARLGEEAGPVGAGEPAPTEPPAPEPACPEVDPSHLNPSEPAPSEQPAPDPLATRRHAEPPPPASTPAPPLPLDAPPSEVASQPAEQEGTLTPSVSVGEPPTPTERRVVLAPVAWTPATHDSAQRRMVIYLPAARDRYGASTKPMAGRAPPGSPPRTRL